MTILDQIVLQIRADLVETKVAMPEARLRLLAEAVQPNADFAGNLSRPQAHPRVIAELKKASPSKGLIRADFQPVALAGELADAGAAALSVLTERHFFQGGAEVFTAVRQAVSVPLLRKDFIVDRYQLLEAKIWGADAVLLIAAALDDRLYSQLYGEARELGLHVLSEVHNREELKMVLAEGAQVIGVNSRDLKTFNVDLEVTAELIGAIPPGMVRVAESGVRSSADMARLQAAGADAFLIGETLMRAESPGRMLRELLTGGSEKQG